RSVFSYQYCPVKTKYNGKGLDRYVMYHLIVGSLHEARINITENLHALGGHASTQCNSMLFAYAHVKSTVRHFFHHEFQGTSAWHGWCNGKYPVVLFRQLDNGVPENVLIFWRLNCIVRFFINLTGDLIE